MPASALATDARWCVAAARSTASMSAPSTTCAVCVHERSGTTRARSTRPSGAAAVNVCGALARGTADVAGNVVARADAPRVARATPATCRGSRVDREPTSQRRLASSVRIRREVGRTLARDELRDPRTLSAPTPAEARSRHGVGRRGPAGLRAYEPDPRSDRPVRCAAPCRLPPRVRGGACRAAPRCASRGRASALLAVGPRWGRGESRR